MKFEDIDITPDPVPLVDDSEPPTPVARSIRVYLVSKGDETLAVLDPMEARLYTQAGYTVTATTWKEVN